MKTFKKIFLSKKAIALELVFAIVLAGALWFFINKASNNFSQDVDMDLVNGSDSTLISTPIDGTAPTDHDPKKNIYYTLHRLASDKSFIAYSSGETITQVAFVGVSQKIKAYRVVNNGEVYKESLSHSSFKGVGVRNYVKGDNFVTLNASAVSSVDDVTWETDAKKISKDDYIALYGYVPNGITGYIFTDETIVNAEYLGEDNGLFSYRYELDTVKSVAKLGLEMRTMAGTASLPIFERVFITVQIDSNWRVRQTTTDCTYKVDMLGGVTCTETITEIYSNHGEDVEIPNAEFYRGYLDDDVSDVGPSELDATGYLMAGFSDYITGSKPLKVALNLTGSSALPLSIDADALINIDINNLANISAFIDINSLSFDSYEFSDLFVAYKNNDIYLGLKDIKAKANINDAISKIGELLPLFGVEMPSLDLGEIDLTSLLSGATVTKVDDNVAVNLPISLGDLSLNATLNFTEGDDIVFVGATATVAGLNISLTPDEDIQISDNLDGYSDILSVLDVIDDNGNIGLDVSIAGINAQVNLSINPFALDIKLGDITAKLADNTVYINYKDIKAKLALNDIEGIINTLAPILDAHGIELPELGGITIDTDALISELLDNLNTEVVADGVKISTVVFDIPVSIVLASDNNAYTIDGIYTTISGLDIAVEPTSETFDAITDVENYNDIASLLNIINNNAITLSVKLGDINALVKVDLLTLTVDVELNSLTVDGLVIGDITAKLADNVIYINYKDIKAKLALNDIEGIINTLAPILNAHGVELPELGNISIDTDALVSELLDNLTTETVADGVKVSTVVFDIPVSIVLGSENNAYTIDGIYTTISGLDIAVEPTTETFDAITDIENYNDIASLLNIINDNAITLSVKLGDINALVKVDLLTLTVDVKLNSLTIDGLVIGDITAKLADNVIYINYKDIKAKLALNDIEGILSTLAPILNAHGIELPELGGITIDTDALVSELLDNLTTETVADGVKVSTVVFDIPVSIVLGSENNAYTIDGIYTTISGLDIAVKPTTATFDAISDIENYNDIASLLDMIDSNNDIHLSILFDGADIRATLSLDDLIVTATYDGLEVYVNLKTGDVYLTYPGVLATVNINDADYILEKLQPILAKFMDTDALGDLDFGAFTTIDVQSIIDGLSVVNSENSLALGLNLNGVELNVIFDTTNGLKLAEVQITMADTVISAVVLDTPNVIPVFDFSLEYSDAKALVEEFSDIIANILYADDLSVKATGSIVTGNTKFTVLDSDITIADLSTAPRATAYIVVEQADLAEDGSVISAFTHTITLIYLDPSLTDGVNVYFTYDNSLDNTSDKTSKLEGTFTTTKASETWDIIKEIYKLMPDIQKALDGILVPDENGYPTLPKFDFPVTELIKSISFKDGLLSGYLDTSVIMDSLPSLLGAEIKRGENSLDVTIPTFDLAGISVGLGVNIAVPVSAEVTDDMFSFDTTNANDFSSINELLMTLKNTATARSFHITGSLSALINEWEIASEAVSLDIKLDVTEDGLTFAKVVITRKDTSIVGLKTTWNDYGGTSTLYFDAENELIYVHVKSKTKYFGSTYSNTYYTYTVEEYTSDLMNRIFELVNLSSTIQNLITKEDTSSETTNTTPATVENTLTKYAYDEAKNQFNIELDLTALLTDIGLTQLTITHNDDMKLTNLFAKVNMVNIINLTLDADMESQGVYQGVKEDLANVKSQFPTK